MKEDKDQRDSKDSVDYTLMQLVFKLPFKPRNNLQATIFSTFLVLFESNYMAVFFQFDVSQMHIITILIKHRK